MESVLSFADIAWALGLLLLPVLLALPLRVGWRFIVGRTHEDNTYRNHVKRIIHAGMQVEHFRDELDDMARHLRLANRKSRLIEADLLYPLRMPHFLLAPALLVLPLAFFLALPVMIIGLPILIILEHILIKRRVLIRMDIQLLNVIKII